METIAKTRQKADFTGQPVYLGLDTHKKSWTVSVYFDEIEHKTFTQPPKPIVLADYLKRNFPGADYFCCYEAGFSGYWALEELNKLGLNCIIANPGDIPTTDKDKSQKRDPVDSRKIGKALRGGLLEGIYVPSKDIQMDRVLMRSRQACSKDLNRIKNRIKMLLHFSGVAIPEELQSKRTDSKILVKWLEGTELPGPQGPILSDVGLST